MTRPARPLSKIAATKARSSFAWWCRVTHNLYPRLNAHAVEDVASRAWCAWLRADHKAPLDLMPRRVVIDAARCEFGRSFKRVRFLVPLDALDKDDAALAAPQASDAVSSELLDDVFSHAKECKNSRRLRRLLVHVLRGGARKDFALAENVTRFRISQLFGDLSEIVARWQAAQRRR